MEIELPLFLRKQVRANRTIGLGDRGEKISRASSRTLIRLSAASLAIFLAGWKKAGRNCLTFKSDKDLNLALGGEQLRGNATAHMTGVEH